MELTTARTSRMKIDSAVKLIIAIRVQVAKQAIAPHGEAVSFPQRVALAAVAGAAGGLVGTPADLVNVRMQNDIKLPPETRRKWELCSVLALN